MRKTNAGLLQNVQSVNWSHVAQLENQVLSKPEDNSTIFYIEPNGDIKLLTNKLLSYDVRDIAFHKISVLSSTDNLEIKQDYTKKNNDWLLSKTYTRIKGEDFWQPVVPENTALLGKALLGKMILGRRY